MKHDKPMNILMMDHYLTVGGVATYLKTLAKGMMERNHTVWLLTTADDANRSIIDDFTSCGIYVRTVPHTRNRLVTVFQFVKHIYTFLKKTPVDVIHSHHRLANVAGIIASKISGTPHLLTLHVFKNDYKLFIKWWKKEWITVPSQALKNHLIRHYGLKDERIQVIYNSISAEYKINQSKKASLQKSIFNAPKSFYVGYIGRISYEKGVDVLVESMPLVKEKCPKVAFRIFGDGPELYALKQRCRELGLPPDALFQGTNYHVNELLALMDVGVIPSRAESFSLFALECMRARKPVIASRVGGITEVVMDNQTGLLVDAEDPEGLAASIIKIYSNRSMMRDFAENGHQRFEKKFPLEAFYRFYELKYQSLINMSQAGGA